MLMALLVDALMRCATVAGCVKGGVVTAYMIVLCYTVWRYAMLCCAVHLVCCTRFACLMLVLHCALLCRAVVNV